MGVGFDEDQAGDDAARGVRALDSPRRTGVTGWRT